MTTLDDGVIEDADAAPQAEQAALQTTLAGEHAAVWTLSLLGARTSESMQPTLAASIQAAYDAHQRTRDDLIALIAGLGLTPVAAAPAYAAPGGLTTVDGVTAAARAVEQACLPVYVGLVAASTGDLRRTAVGLLDATAVRVLSFQGDVETLPGAAELADR